MGDSERCIDEEIPFEIPDNWIWVRLYAICNIVMGSSPDGGSLSTNRDGVEFHQGKTYFTDKFVSNSHVRTISPVRMAPAMSILMSVRAPVGDVNITDREICIGRGLASILPSNLINLDYLYVFLTTQKEKLEHEGTGTTFKAIGKDNITQMLIPIPPLLEQERIVDKLYQLFLVCRKLNY